MKPECEICGGKIAFQRLPKPPSRLKKHGKQSEKLSDEQLELMEMELGVKEAEVATEAEIPVESRPVKVREHAGRNPLQAHLKRREKLIASDRRACLYCEETRCMI